MSKRSTALYLNDILDSIQKIDDYTKGISYGEFSKDDKTIDAVVRNLEIIGEATRQMPESFKDKHPDLPWGKIISMRNKVIHEYSGVDVEIPPLPAEVTTEVAEKLRGEGFTIVYIPSLDLLPDQFKKQDPKDYLSELARIYPNWRRYESLSPAEQDDPKVCRNLREWFWEKVKDGDIDFPALPGRWLAVETLPKPAWDDKYPETLFSKRLEFKVSGSKVIFDRRHSVPWDYAKEAFDKAESRFLSDIGLPRGNLRFLEILEWNLLGNRFGWGATDSYELTNTEARRSPLDGGSHRLIVGGSNEGGLLSWLGLATPSSAVGFASR